LDGELQDALVLALGLAFEVHDVLAGGCDTFAGGVAEDSAVS
jgi:hypothetical protein